MLDELNDEDLIMGSHRSKSVYLSEEGVKRAIQIINRYNLEGSDLNSKKEDKR